LEAQRGKDDHRNASLKSEVTSVKVV
jgi:hypothetical protein